MKATWFALSIAVVAVSFSTPSRSAQAWTEGVNYFLVQPPRPTSAAKGKIEVTEVFSYACPACNLFQPTIHKLKQSLPPNAVLTFLPAAFNPGEDWPMFQKAFYTAQVLGVDQQTHDAMFDAVWKGGPLAVIDPQSGGLSPHMPAIEDAARFYKDKAGVPVEKFIATSKSFAVDLKIRTAEDLIVAYKVDRTPTMIVNGKYRVNVQSAGSPDKVIELVNYLVEKEGK